MYRNRIRISASLPNNVGVEYDDVFESSWDYDFYFHLYSFGILDYYFFLRIRLSTSPIIFPTGETSSRLFFILKIFAFRSFESVMLFQIKSICFFRSRVKKLKTYLLFQVELNHFEHSSHSMHTQSIFFSSVSFFVFRFVQRKKTTF